MYTRYSNWFDSALRAPAATAIMGTAMIPLFGLASSAEAAPLVLTPSADAEIREDEPERQRGSESGGMGELSIRVTSGQNRAALIRFDLTGITAADIEGFADLRLFSRSANLGGTANPGGVKIFGLKGSTPLASTWDETTVHYRDAGMALPVVTGGHPVSQPAPGNPIVGAPVAPITVSDLGVTAPGWGSDPNSPTRAPGLRHENPPYSAVVETTNANRYQNNLAIRAAYLADLDDNGTIDNGPYIYENYLNQPSYMTQSGPSDLFTFDVPGSTVGTDVDMNHAILLGYLNYDAKADGRPAGTVFSFATGLEDSPINMGPDQYNANRASLVAYLTELLNAGYTDANFLIVQKNNVDNDPLPRRSDNLPFASKEFIPVGMVQGAWAPQLILAPEPGSIAVLGIAAASLLGRRSRRRA